MQDDGLSVVSTSSAAPDPPETIAYFFVDNNSSSGTRVLSECVLRPGTSPSLLLRLTQLVAKDLLAAQKLRPFCNDSCTLTHNNSMNSNSNSNTNSNFNNSNVNHNSFSAYADAALRCKLVHLPDVSVSLASLFCECPSLRVHFAATLVVAAPPACWPAASARLHMAFPALRDWMHLACQRALSRTAASSASASAVSASAFSASAFSASAFSASAASSAQSDSADAAAREWADCFPSMASHLSGWLRAGVSWRALGLRGTVLPFTPPAQLVAIVSAALGHHCCVLRGDDAALVERWLHTVALFLQDAQLAMTSAVCGRCVGEIVPDLALQGTLCPVADIAAVLPLFRRPPVVLDVGRRVEEPHHLFPVLTLIGFRERCLAAALGARVDWNGQFRTKAVNRAASPLVESVLRRVCAAALGHASPLGSRRPSSAGNDYTEGCVSIAAGVDEIPKDAASRALLAIAHWRCEVQLRALSLVVANRSTNAVPTRRATIITVTADESDSSGMIEPRVRVTPVHAADRRVLEVAVASLTQLREAAEMRDLENLFDLFTF